MIERTLLTIAFLFVTSSAQAAWDVGGALEDYQWIEYPDASTDTPREYGLRSALFLNWTQEGDQDLLLAWRAKFYGGTVNYDTFLQSTGAPVSTKTDYGGVVSEGQLFFRTSLGDYKLDYLGGPGLDSWRRSIRITGGNQIEDYFILFFRAGLRLAKPRQVAGLHGELGIKYPFSARENVHLDSMGYTSNPWLSPGGMVSGYAELGYRINARFDVLGYYDSWRFGRSANVIAADTAGALWRIYQPKSNMDALGIKLLVSF